MTRFKAPVEYRRTTEGRDVGSVSRFAGMPIGFPQMMTDWQWEYIAASGLSAANSYATADWTKTKIGASADPAITVANGQAFVQIANTAADNDALQIQNTGNGQRWLLTGDRPLYFECMIRNVDANNNALTVTKTDWFVGLAVVDTTILPGATDYVGFHHLETGDALDGTSRIALVAGKAGGAAAELRDQSVTSTGWVATGAPGASVSADRAGKFFRANQWIKLAFLIEPHNSGAAGDLFAWVNNEPVPSCPVSLGANVPDASLVTTFAVRNGEGVIKELDLFYYFVAQALYDDSIPPVFI